MLLFIDFVEIVFFEFFDVNFVVCSIFGVVFFYVFLEVVKEVFVENRVFDVLRCFRVFYGDLEFGDFFGFMV